MSTFEGKDLDLLDPKKYQPCQFLMISFCIFVFVVVLTFVLFSSVLLKENVVLNLSPRMREVYGVRFHITKLTSKSFLAFRNVHSAFHYITEMQGSVPVDSAK